MKSDLRLKLNENNILEVHVDLYNYEWKNKKCFYTTYLSIPTGILDKSIETTAVPYVCDKTFIYKGEKFSKEELCLKVIREHPLLINMFNVPIDLDNLQPGYIDKYNIPFYYDSDKEQVVDDNQLKTWLYLNQNSLLVISDRLAYYLVGKI